MQERILNYRQTWDLVGLNYAKWNDNITANFYPVNSAIQIRDKTKYKTFTIMNDRSQSGTSLTDGTIQLMQNRRLFADDSKGVGEALNERDENGDGMRVKATYYIEFNDKLVSKSRSRQRTIQ